MASFRAFFKNKLRLTKSLPAPIIHSTFGYNLAHLYDRQMLAKSSDLLKMINDIALLGNTTRLRVMQLQLLEWLPLSPITNWPYNNPSKFKDWWSAFLSAAKLASLTFGQCLDGNFNLTQIMGGSIPISSILPQDTYRKSIKNIRILSLMFVDQLVSMEGHHLFTSFDINWLFNTNISRANWFLKLESQLITNTSSRVMSRTCVPHRSICDLPMTTIQMKENDNNNPTFVVIWSNQYMTYIIGKVKAIDNDTIYAQHYINTYDSNFRADVNPCNRCNLFDHTAIVTTIRTNIQNFCAMKFPAQYCTEIKVQYNKHIGWRCSLSDLMLREVALSKLTNPYQYPSMPLPNLNILPFDTCSIKLLDTLKSNFTSASFLQFYTDGSLTSLGSSNCRLGIAWLQTDSN